MKIVIYFKLKYWTDLKWFESIRGSELDRDLTNKRVCSDLYCIDYTVLTDEVKEATRSDDRFVPKSSSGRWQSSLWSWKHALIDIFVPTCLKLCFPTLMKPAQPAYLKLVSVWLYQKISNWIFSNFFGHTRTKLPKYTLRNHFVPTRWPNFNLISKNVKKYPVNPV